MVAKEYKEICDILAEKMHVHLDRFEEKKEYTKLELLDIITTRSLELNDKQSNELSNSLSRIQKICGMKPTIKL